MIIWYLLLLVKRIWPLNVRKTVLKYSILNDKQSRRLKQKSPSHRLLLISSNYSIWQVRSIHMKLTALYVRNTTIRMVIELYFWMKRPIHTLWRVLDLVMFYLYAKLPIIQQWTKLLNANLSNNQRLRIESIWDTTHWIRAFHLSSLL
jgi:hypothetical protein